MNKPQRSYFVVMFFLLIFSSSAHVHAKQNSKLITVKGKIDFKDAKVNWQKESGFCPDIENSIFYMQQFRPMTDFYPKEYYEWSAQEQYDWLRSDAGKKAGKNLSHWRKNIRKTFAFKVDPKTKSFLIKDIPEGMYNMEFRVKRKIQGPMLTGAIFGTSFPFDPDDYEREEGKRQLIDIGTVSLGVRNDLDVGQFVPDFELKDFQGNIIRLSDYKGKFVLIDFWATWCGNCLKETPKLKALYEKYKPTGRFEIIGLSHDRDAKSLKKYIAKNEIVWPNIFLGPKDPIRRKLSKQFAVQGFPTMIIVGPNGEYLEQGAGGPIGLDFQIRTWLKNYDKKLENLQREKDLFEKYKSN